MYQGPYGKKPGFGISFFVSDFEGKRRIGHGGAVYGFATDLSALPDDKLGVIVVASKDVANAVTRRGSDYALRGLLALKQGKPLPRLETTEKLDAELARSLAGRYRCKDQEVELSESAGRLYLTPKKGGVRMEVRGLGKDLMADDVTGYGPMIVRQGESLQIGSDAYARVPAPQPQQVPEKWRGLIGEYGPDHNILYILEKDNRLHALIEWVFLYPLTEVTADVYKFPDFGLYMGDKIVFKRDRTGRATEADAASVLFRRRALKGESSTYKIDPVSPGCGAPPGGAQGQAPGGKGAFQKV